MRKEDWKKSENGVYQEWKRLGEGNRKSVVCIMTDFSCLFSRKFRLFVWNFFFFSWDFSLFYGQTLLFYSLSISALREWPSEQIQKSPIFCAFQGVFQNSHSVFSTFSSALSSFKAFWWCSLLCFFFVLVGKWSCRAQSFWNVEQERVNYCGFLRR